MWCISRLVGLLYKHHLVVDFTESWPWPAAAAEEEEEEELKEN